MKTTKELKDYLEQFVIPNTEDILLGIFQPGMTVYNQQLRALNIFYAAFRTEKIKKGDKLAVIGAGMAGLSFTLAALSKGCKVDLFEKSSLLLPFQYGNDTRRIHPHFYNWPKPKSEYPYSDLPFFRWKHETASTVSKDIYRDFKKEVNSYKEDEYNEYQTEFITKNDITRIGNVVKISFKIKGDGQKNKTYDKLIFAIGFGTERTVNCNLSDVEVLTDSYWRNDQFEQVNLYKSEVVNYVVSGTGDGALMDVLRLKIKGFTTDSIVNNFGDIKEYESLKVELKKVEKEFRDLNDKDTPTDTFLYDKFEILNSNGLFETCKKELEKRIRFDTRVVIHHRNLNLNQIFNLNKASFFNSLITYILFKLNELEFYKDDLKLKYEKTDKLSLTNVEKENLIQEAQSNDDSISKLINNIHHKLNLSKPIKVLIRHGADKSASLTKIGLDEIQKKELKSKQEFNTKHNHLEPIWPYDFFEDNQNQKMFVEPELVSIANTFVSGVASFVDYHFPSNNGSFLRICLHRVIKRSNDNYYQQISEYFGNHTDNDKSNIGRIFPLEKGLVGYSLLTGRSLRLSKNDDDNTAWKLLMMLPETRIKNKDKTFKSVKDVSKSLFTCPIFCNKDEKLYPVFCLYIDSSEFTFKDEHDKEILELVYRMCSEFVSQLNDMILDKKLLKVDDLTELLPKVDEKYKDHEMNSGIEKAKNLNRPDLFSKYEEELNFKNITPNYMTLNYRYES